MFRQNKTNINKYPKTQGPIQKKNNHDEWTVINSMDKERAHTWKGSVRKEERERECRTQNKEGLNNTKESGPYKNVSPM